MGGGKSQQKVDLKEVKEKQTVARSQLLRGACVFLTEGAFRQRKAYLTAKVGLAILGMLFTGVVMPASCTSVLVCALKICSCRGLVC